MKNDANCWFRRLRALGVLWIALLLLAGDGAATESLAERWVVETQEDGGPFTQITQGNSERGMTYSAVADQVLVVSRAGGLEVLVLDAADADFSHTLLTDGVGGGIFPLNVIGAAEDGAIYAANLVLGSGSTSFKIYRWADSADDTVATIAFEGDPAGVDGDGLSLDPQRWGDTIAVRGSGVNTQILLGSRSSSKVAVLTTTDGETFTTTPLAGVGNATGNLGVAFGAGDTIYSKDANQPLRYASFDLVAGTASSLGSFTTLPNLGRPIGVDAENMRLAVLTTNANPLKVLLYDISDPSLEPIFADEAEFDTTNQNINATGAAAFGEDSLFVLQTNNGLAAYDIEDDDVVDPPVIATQPDGRTVIEGGGVSFFAVVSGSPPFTYQWSKDNVEIAGETASILTIPVVEAADAGSYTLQISNPAGSETTDPAVLVVESRVDGDIASTKWQLGNDDRAYLATDNAQRGLAINPVNGNVLLVSRTGGTSVRVLDGADGADLHSLDLTGVGGDGAIFALSMIGVADDGAVYASNLSLNGAQYRIYRWADDEPGTLPTVAFDAAAAGDPLGGQRLGDTIAVRGAGIGTQIIVAARSTPQAVLFTTSDGESFDATPLSVTGATGNFGLGLSFGAGNVFWGNAQGGSLVRIGFDLVAESASVTNTFTTADFAASVGPISVAPQYGLLAGISNENPDHIRVYDISDLGNPPVLLDQEFLISDEGNSNGTGALAFGSGVLVGLGTNNGVTCLTLDVPEITSADPFISDVLSLGGNQIQFTLNGKLGKSYTIQDSETLTGEDWDDATTITLSTGDTQQFTFAISPGARFFRAREEE